MFVLLKLLLFLFRPLIWIVILFIYTILTKNPRRKRLAFRVTFGFLLFFTNPFIYKQFIAAYEVEPVQLAPSQTFNTGILLGGMVSYNKEENKGYFNNVADRFIQTALLYKQGHIRNILVAAGNGYITKNNFSEAVYIKEKLVQLGVPADKIYTDSKSRNTLENAQYAKRLADSAGLSGPYLLISSAMHLRRAEKVFTNVGIQPTLYPCNFLGQDKGNNFLEDYLLPSSESFTRWDNLIKEALGILAYSVTGKI
jgi:uncharacterized SAM-binding protein YcdF (DUF218 family)